MFTGKQLQWLRKTLNIAVVHGGEKSHPQSYIYKNLNPRSTKTYKAVACDIALSLQESGFEHVQVLPEDINLPLKLKALGIDLVFINSGGLQGFDSMCHLPSMLEMLGIPYIGHSPMTAGILDNKHLFKHKIRAAGIPTTPFITIENEESVNDGSKKSMLDKMESNFGCAFIVKPVSGRASIHVYPVMQRSQLAEVVEKVKVATNNTVMIEPYLSGREFVVAVAGNILFKNATLTELDQPFSFSVMERLLLPDEKIFTSMDVKPITGDRLRPVTDSAVRQQLVDIGQKIFVKLGLQTLVRVDLRMDSNDNLYVLEANPKPDLKRPQGNELSIVCCDLESEGMFYNDLIQSLLFNRLYYLSKHRSETVKHCFSDEFYSLALEGNK